MSTKTPFELRFDVLKMAKEMMDQQYDIAQQQFWTQLEQYKEASKDVNEVFEKYTPTMYQPAEIMAKAEELYKFVIKKD
jgi:Ethanolamine utilization protein EutJ (predicted chaperonin)